ncbi:hypothetical protein JMUB5695_00275 [Mycobacterium heckeshornense]|nr:hypothetical protein JMUB5695_00275 [Mycobacterium heckeshornense]
MHQVFQIANNRAHTLHTLGDNLQTIQKMVLEHWQGEAGAAFQADMDKARADIETNGQESKQVAAAVGRAEADVRWCRSEAQRIKEVADSNLWTITPDWRVQIPDTARIGLDPIAVAAEQQALQTELDQLKVRAHATDHELATAIRASVGEIPLDDHGQSQAPGQPKPDDGATTPADQLPLPTKGGHPPSPTEATRDNNSPDVSRHLADNPHPSPLLAGLSAQEWRERLAHFHPGDPLPDPRTPTGDKAIDALAYAAGQQNTTYAWGANKSTDGPSRGQGDNGQGANQNHDWDRYGYDCGGLVRYSVAQGAGFDVGQGTNSIDSNSLFAHPGGGLPSSAVVGKAHPGDVLVFGGARPYAGASTDHTGIYIGNGYMINAPESGEPVRVDPVAGHGPADILRMP